VFTNVDASQRLPPVHLAVLFVFLGICYFISQALYAPQYPDATRNALAAWCSLAYFVAIVAEAAAHALACGFLLYNNESISDFLSPSKREARRRERQEAEAQDRSAAAADATAKQGTDAGSAAGSYQASAAPPYLRDPWNVFSAVIISIAAVT
jgi:hypothetical protein